MCYVISIDSNDLVSSTDSAIEETLRLVAAPFLSRNVVKDLWLKRDKMADLLFRKGDRLVLFPFLSPQHDPEVHDYPHVGILITPRLVSTCLN